jgi:hypothetical protein
MRPSRVVVESVGDTNPETRGFTSGKELDLPEKQKHRDLIALGPSQGSWRIKNPILGATVYKYELSDSDLRAALDGGWQITLKTNLLELTSPDGCIYADFDTGNRRYDLNIVPAFPNQTYNKKLLVRLNRQVIREGSAAGSIPANELIDGSRPHKYALRYQPATSYATLFVDDQMILAEKYEGHTDFVTGQRLLFGVSGAEATFTLVKFEVFP